MTASLTTQSAIPLRDHGETAMLLKRQRLLLTLGGQEELTAELAYLEQLRDGITADIQKISFGGAASIEERSQGHQEVEALNLQIGRLRRVLVDAELIRNDSALVAIGSQVTIVGDEGVQMFTVVGPVEANPRLGHISYESDLAKAILGHGVGDEVEVVSFEGQRRRLKILAIRQVPLEDLAR